MTPESIDRLKSQLLTSGLSQKDNPLFQIINQLIDAVKEGLIANAAISGGGGGGLNNQTFLVWGPKPASLPNSRQLVAGQGINLVVGSDKVTINAVVLKGKDGVDGIDGMVGPKGDKGDRGDKGQVVNQRPPIIVENEIQQKIILVE